MSGMLVRVPSGPGWGRQLLSPLLYPSIGKFPMSTVDSLAAWYNAEQVQGETLLEDNFQRPDGSLGSVPGPGDPVAWTADTGTASIVSGQAVLTGAATNHQTVEAGAADGVVSATVVNPNNGNPGVAFRGIDVDNHMLASVTSTEVRVYKRDTSSYVLLGSETGLTVPSNVLLSVVFSGDLVRVFLDGVFQFEFTMSAADYAQFGAGTEAGLRCGSTTSTFDNFSVRTLTPSTDLAAAVDTFSRSTAAEIVDLDDGTTALRLPSGSVNGASTPTFEGLGVTDVDLRWRGSFDQVASGSVQALVARWDSTGGDRSYGLSVSGSGSLAMEWSTDGAGGGSYNALSSDLTALIGDGQRVSLRGTVDVDNGSGGHDVALYYRFDDNDEWLTLNSRTTGGTTTIHDGSTSLDVGTRQGVNTLGGTVEYVEVRDGIDGTVVASPDFTAETAGTTSFADDQGNTWTVNQSHGSIGSTETGEAAATAWLGSAQISNSKLSFLAAANYRIYANWPGVDLDQDISANIVWGDDATQRPGILLSYVNATNYLILRCWNDGTFALVKNDGGVFSTLDSNDRSAVSSGDRDVMRTIRVGDRVWCYLNGELRIEHTLSTADHALYNNEQSGLHAIGGGLGDATVDNFRVSRPPLVPVFPDLSGKHRHAVQTDVDLQPVLLTNVQNGRPVLRFDGVDDLLRNTSAFNLAQPNTVLVTCQSDASANHRPVDSASGSNQHALYGQGSAFAMWAGSALTAALYDTNWHAHAGVFNTTSSKLRLDGATVASGNASVQTMDGLTIGAHSSTSPVHKGDIAELVVADANLDATGELANAENYLIRRWT